MSFASSLKVTSVQKNSTIKPAVVSDHSPQYTSFRDREMCDPKVVEDMVRSIGSLDKDGHKQVYMTIRRFKPKTFFAANSLDTRFNIYGLSDRERQELDHTIQLCLQNMERNKIFKEARNTHKQDLAELDVKLTDIDTETDNDIGGYIDAVNPSEAEKIREMLQLNNTFGNKN